MSKTFQYTNKHGRKVQVDQEVAKFIHGKMSFDGEVVLTTKKQRVKDENGKSKKDENGKYIYEEVKSFELDPESTPDAANSDYVNTGKRVELRSSIDKGGNEAPQSKAFKNKKSVK